MWQCQFGGGMSLIGAAAVQEDSGHIAGPSHGVFIAARHLNFTAGSRVSELAGQGNLD